MMIFQHHPKDKIYVRAYLRPGHPNELIVERPKLSYMERVQHPLVIETLQKGLTLNSEVLHADSVNQHNNRYVPEAYFLLFASCP